MRVVEGDPLRQHNPSYQMDTTNGNNTTAVTMYPIEQFPQLASVPTTAGNPADILYKDDYVAVVSDAGGNNLVVKDPMGMHPILGKTKIKAAIDKINAQISGGAKAVMRTTEATSNKPTWLQALDATELGKDPSAVLQDEAKQMGQRVKKTGGYVGTFLSEATGIDRDDLKFAGSMGLVGFVGIGAVAAVVYFGVLR